MSRGGTRIRAEKKPVVVLAGEDSNDRKVMRKLLEEFCPEMRGRIVEINQTVRLKAASDTRLPERIQVLARRARARATREDADLACVFVHEDFDEPFSTEYDQTKAKVEAALRRELPHAHYVLATAETEAWLLLFPKALQAQGWKVPKTRLGKDTGRLGDPKRVLREEVNTAQRCYREADAPAIIDKAVESGEIRQPSGVNRSWEDFRTGIQECCSQHLPRQRR